MRFRVKHFQPHRNKLIGTAAVVFSHVRVEKLILTGFFLCRIRTISRDPAQGFKFFIRRAALVKLLLQPANKRIGYLKSMTKLVNCTS